MEMVFNLAAGKVTLQDSPDAVKLDMTIDWKVPQDTKGHLQLAFELSRELFAFFKQSENGSHDELIDVLNRMQVDSVERMDYEYAAACRDSKNIITRLTEQNAILREQVKNLGIPQQARPPYKPPED